MTRSFYQRPEDIEALRDAGYVGQPLSGTRLERREGVNADPGVASSHVLTVSSASGSDTFGLSLGGVAYSTTTTSGATTTTLAAAELAAWINNTEALAMYGYATASGAAVTWQAWTSGADYDFTPGSLVGNWSVSSTAGQDAIDIPFGRAVIQVARPSSGVFNTQHEAATALSTRHVALPSTANAAAKTIVFTFGGSYTAEDTIQIDGAYRVGRALNTINYPAASGSGEGLEEALTDASTGLDTLDGVSASSTATTLTVTFAAGYQGDVRVTPSSGVTVSKAVSNDIQIDEKLLGVSQYTHDQDTDTIGEYATSYRANCGVKLIAKGAVYVEVPSADAALIAAGESQVWIGTGASERGQFFAQSGTDRASVPTSALRFRKVRGTIALLDCFLG